LELPLGRVLANDGDRVEQMNKVVYAVLGLCALGGCVAILYWKWDWVLQHEPLTVGFLTAFVLLVALIAALLQLSAMRHERATSIATYLSQSYDSGIILEGRKLVYTIEAKHKALGIQDTQDAKSSFLNTVLYYEDNHVDDYMRLTSIPAFFDLIGWLVRNKCCDAKAIDEQIDWEHHYKMWEDYIRHYQKKYKQTTFGDKCNDKPDAFYGNFVWLADKLGNLR